ncbi:MAG TPA: hypothetical protein VFR40_03445 [Lapillicoccus sp.]|nr:hypothetical protein [Lapillicoccus sp.]
MPYVSGFLPSRSAPLFHNGPWPAGLDLRISLAGLPAASIDVTQMGLCGGMSFLARDIFESGTPQLRSTSSRGIPLPLGRHILSRLLDSFLGPGVIPYWIHATQELDHGTWFWGKGLYAETVEAARQVMRYVDAGGLVPIGVVLAQSAWPWDVFQNHVELVYGYDLVGSQLTLHVYDCNFEGSDNVTITLDIGSTAPARPILTNGTSQAGQSGLIRGFFVLPYQRKDPTPAYIDDGRVDFAGTVPTSVAPGETVNVSVTIENTGSTTFESGRGYRLGTQSPPDNTEWGTARFELTESVDPGRVSTQPVSVRAPLDGAATLQLQLLRESVHWFGEPSEAVPVTVSTPAPVG